MPDRSAPSLADPAQQLPPRLVFGGVEVHPRERRLRVDGQPVTLGARAFDLLLALVRQPHRLRTKAELLDEVWPGLVVEEANLSVQVSTLRKALGGDCIATVPGHGYRFTATVGADQGSGASRADPASAPAAAAPGPAAPGPAAPPVAAPAVAAPPAAASSLPAARPLIGRRADLARLRAALAVPGCVTLTGPAGVGKTSLARALGQGHEGGAVWVDLAPLADGDLVAPALARTLGVALPATEERATVLAARIGARLLLLDNAEHLVDAASALVGALLEVAPALTVLVTSQRPLALTAERVQRLEPLAVPREGAAPDPAATGDGAAALFIARAKAAQHRFAPGSEALLLIDDICRRLDGMPLALEMAAARVPTLGLKGVRDALAGERFALLTTGYRDAAGRHRTLRSALDWSHGLLSAEEQRLFRRLAVFSGGFSLDLLVAVAGEQGQERWAVIDTLAALVDRSLVDADSAEPPRYRLLETMRAYALEQLAAAGEEPAVRRRHAQALLDLFERSHLDLAVREGALREHDNARDAAAWARQHDARLAVQLVTWIGRATSFAPWRAQARAWLEATEGLVDDPAVPLAERAVWWDERARHHLYVWSPRAAEFALRALALHRQADHVAGMFNALQVVVRSSQQPRPDFPELLAELATLADRLDSPRAPINLHGARAHVAEVLGDHEAALAHRRNELASARAAGDVRQTEATESAIAETLARLGRFDEAIALTRDLLARPGIGESLNEVSHWLRLVVALMQSGDAQQALAEVQRGLRTVHPARRPMLAKPLPDLLLRLGRPHAAALMLGHVQALGGAGLLSVSDREGAAWAAARGAVDERLGPAEAARLMECGRGLETEAVAGLVADTLAGAPDAAG